MRLAATLYRRRYLYLLVLIVMPIGVALFGRHQLSVYESSAYISVSRSAYLSQIKSQYYNSFLSPATNEVNVMVELLQSETFAADVASNTPLAQYYDLTTSVGRGAAAQRVRNDTMITASTLGPDTLTVTVQDKDPLVAQQVASSFIAQVVANDNQSELDLDKQASTFFTQQLTAAKALLAQDQTRQASYETAHPEVKASPQLDPQYQQLLAQVKQDGDNVTSLQTTLNQIGLDQAAARAGISNIKVQDAPAFPTKTTFATKTLIFFALGGLAGALLLVLAIAGVYTLVNRRVYSVDDVRAVFADLDIDPPHVEPLPMLSGGGWKSPGKSSRGSPVGRALAPLLGPRASLHGKSPVGQLPQPRRTSIRDDGAP